MSQTDPDTAFIKEAPVRQSTESAQAAQYTNNQSKFGVKGVGRRRGWMGVLCSWWWGGGFQEDSWRVSRSVGCSVRWASSPAPPSCGPQRKHAHYMVFTSPTTARHMSALFTSRSVISVMKLEVWNCSKIKVRKTINELQLSSCSLVWSYHHGCLCSLMWVCGFHVWKDCLGYVFGRLWNIRKLYKLATYFIGDVWFYLIFDAGLFFIQTIW